MPSKNKAQHMVSHPVNTSSTLLHTPPPPPPPPPSRSSAASREPPLRKLLKTISNCSGKSSATDATAVEKYVRFKKKDMLRNTLSIKDYTPDEVRATWYVSEDYKRISRRCQKEIRKMNKGDRGELKDKKKYCSRGLEGHTNAGFAVKERNRIIAFNAVLKEQLAQWDEGVFDEDAIAEIYIRASSSCQMWANHVGQRDQKRLKKKKMDHPPPVTGSTRSTPGLEKSTVISAAA